MFYMTVPRCVGCNERLTVENVALCKRCLKAHTLLKERNCSRCAKKLNRCDCSNKYLKEHKVKKLIKIFRYIPDKEGTPSNNLIYSLKRNNRADVVRFLADELADAILNTLDSTDGFIITNVPRRGSAIREYGYDHASVLALAVAKRLNIEYRSLLRSKSKKAQKKMSHNERKENAVFVCRKRTDLKGKRLLLLDDIVTTGSSMAASADALKAMGAKQIVGVTVSIAFKDEYTPFKKTEF